MQPNPQRKVYTVAELLTLRRELEEVRELVEHALKQVNHLLAEAGNQAKDGDTTAHGS